MTASRLHRAGLPRVERLRVQADFQRLFRRGVRLEREAFVVLCMPAAGPRAAGFAVSRRLGGSVVRNRARRRLREAYRHQKHAVPESGLRLCFVARRAAVDLPFPVLLSEVAEALRDAARRLAT